MTKTVFLYGTLCDADLFEIVTGNAFDGREASLAGYAIHWAKAQNFPVLLPAPEMCASGFVVMLDDKAAARVSFYETGFGYALTPVTITVDGQTLAAETYVPTGEPLPPGEIWNLNDWQRVNAPLAREAATEYMRLMAIHTPQTAAQCFPQVMMRASSRLRARANPTPRSRTPDMSLDRLEVHETRQPYTAYFAVQEHDLAFPTFSGGSSALVTRATFLGGDAVTVLPYDPKMDCVLVIRQFRHGVYARGDANPWTLEPAAGRIDPGESPEETAHRELQEETGATAKALFHVANYYPSPSAYSEFLYSYVATADLSGQDGTTSGLESEDEDIMSHVVPFNELMALVASGAANTGPLVLSAFWLAANRDRLRQAD